MPKENLIEIKYEEFIKNPIEALERIYKKFNIKNFEKVKPLFESYVKKHENYEGNHYKIEEKTKEKIFKEWEFAFKKFDYNV